MFAGYWQNKAATAEALDDAGWMRTGDLGELDDEGFLRITGRKKEIIVTAGGKNVAPAVLEDRLRAHALVSQCMVVGDNRPFIACLVTLDPESLDPWKKQHGKPAGATVADLATDPDMIADIQAAVDEANQAVSRAESIRRFRILPVDFTEENGCLTPSLKVRRGVVAKDFAADIEAALQLAQPRPGPAWNRRAERERPRAPGWRSGAVTRGSGFSARPRPGPRPPGRRGRCPRSPRGRCRGRHRPAAGRSR